MVNMLDYKKHSFSQLSGGQQQRILLARALCATEKVIVLDEPVTGLDPIATADMYSLIKDINHKGITVIMVTHDINMAVRQASHILHISAGTEGTNFLVLLISMYTAVLEANSCLLNVLVMFVLTVTIRR